MDNFNLRKYLIENQLTHSSVSLNEISIDMLHTHFVDTGRIDKNTFSTILDASQKDSAFATWLTSRVAGTKKVKSIIKKEDISKYKKYLDIFKRNKREYPLKDINMIKDQNALDDFIKKSREIQANEEGDISQQKGLSKSEKYTKLKLGEVDGYEIFKFPKDSKDLYNASCELGAGTSWCTSTGNTDTWFLNYISQGDIYIIINKNNPKDKYQFHYESNSYMDSNDIDIFG